MADQNVLLEIRDLKKHFPIKTGVFRRTTGQVYAVDGVSFSINRGETLGLVGESGCGKTTTGRCIPRLIEPTGGQMFYGTNGEQRDIVSADADGIREFRKKIQIIFQDPFSSLNSRMTIRDIISEPMEVNQVGGAAAEREEYIGDLLERVGLSREHTRRYPHEFSGGQRQRIGIARALALRPDLIICDEPVSALDVSVQAQVLNLLEDLQSEFGLTYLFIAHDLRVVAHLSDRVAIMYLGKIVEMGSTTEVYRKPLHPYAEALMGSIPVGDPDLHRKKKVLPGGVPDPSNPPSGCPFHPRCPYAKQVCETDVPPLRQIGDGTGHIAACHFADELSLVGFEDQIQE